MYGYEEQGVACIISIISGPTSQQETAQLALTHYRAFILVAPPLQNALPCEACQSTSLFNVQEEVKNTPDYLGIW